MTWLSPILAYGKEPEPGEMRFQCPSCEKQVVNLDCCPDCDGPPESAVVMEFKCPFCQRWVDYQGGCPHFAFSFEEVNFEYLTCVEDFEKRTLSTLRTKGYDLDSLPLPQGEWVDNDDDGNPMPSLDRLVSGLKFIEYSSSAPHGHGSWGILLGFEQKERQTKASSRRPKGRG